MKIVFIGSGNIATCLAKNIKQNKEFQRNNEIIQIYSRKIENAIALSKYFKNSISTDCCKDIIQDADLYLFMLPDDVIPNIITEINITNNKAVVAHCSGSLSLNCFEKKNENYAAIYPFQTFSKKAELIFENIPVFYETSNDFTEIQILKFVKDLGFKEIHYSNQKIRETVHLAGIFANNFANHCFYLAEKILADSEIDSDILVHLINQTAVKAMQNGAKNSQTGPSRRNDKKIIEKHIECLEYDKNLQTIYKLMTENIIKTYYNEKF